MVLPNSTAVCPLSVGFERFAWASKVAEASRSCGDVEMVLERGEGRAENVLGVVIVTEGPVVVA